MEIRQWHRCLPPEAAGSGIGTTAAMKDRFAAVLPQVPAGLTAAPPVPPATRGK